MRYCAFLRGINVKGTSMKMADVCAVFQNAGTENVVSVLATGNILFDSEKNEKQLKTVLEKSMADHFDYEAFMFIRKADFVSHAVKNNPFTKSEEYHSYVFISSDEIVEKLKNEFDKGRKSDGEAAKIVQKVFYWKIKKGETLNSDFGKILGKKSLKDKITSRNINTFEKIVAKI